MAIQFCLGIYRHTKVNWKFLPLTLVCMLSFLSENLAQASTLLEQLKATEAYIESNPEKVIRLCDSLLQNESLTSDERAHIYFSKSDAYYYLEDIRGSYQAAAKTLSLATEKFPQKKYLVILNSQGQNFDFLGKLDSAIYIYKKGIPIAKALKDSLELANLYFNIGLSYNQQSAYAQTLTFLDSAYQIDFTLQDSFGLSHVLRAIGYMQELYFEQELAIENYKKALQYVTKQDQAQACAIHTSIGTNYLTQGKLDSTQFYLSLASHCYQNVNDQNTLHYLYSLRAKYLIRKQDTLAAIIALDSASILSQQFGNTYEVLNNKLLMLNLNPTQETEQRYIDILQQAEDNEFLNLLGNGYNWYADYLQGEGNYQAAYEAKVKSEEFTKKKNQQTNQKIIQAQSVKFGLLQKENEIQVANEKLKTQKARWTIFGLLTFGLVLGFFAWYQYQNKRAKLLLQQEKLEKEAALLKEIADVESQAFRAQMNPHFIFNALNSIKGLMINKQEREAALYISKFSKLVRSVLDNSREKVISLAQELETLTLYLKLEQLRFRDGFEFEITVAPAIQANNIAVPPVIIQPFVENSIWHGFKNNQQQNKLAIKVTQQDEELLIEVEDNGVGRAVTAQKKNPTKRKSHGINISRQRMQNFAGTKEQEYIYYTDLRDSAGNAIGTNVSIHLPCKYL